VYSPASDCLFLIKMSQLPQTHQNFHFYCFSLSVLLPNRDPLRIVKIGCSEKLTAIIFILFIIFFVSIFPTESLKIRFVSFTLSPVEELNHNLKMEIKY
jgi:hypothetical protein